MIYIFVILLYLNNFRSQRDDEQISTALGYAVHLLILISKYFHVRFFTITHLIQYSLDIML